MNKFKLVLGDWSQDGHNIVQCILIEANYSVKELKKAYFNSCKLTGVNFEIICSDYEDNKLREHEYKKFIEYKCPFKDLGIDNSNEDEIDLDEDSYIKLLMWFIGLSIKDLQWKRVDDDTPNFNGYWSKEGPTSLGYGLYV